MDFDDFECILFQKWDTNGSQNPSRNWIRKGMPLESDFYDIVVDFAPQNGTQHLLKSYLKTGQKKGTQRIPGMWVERWVEGGKVDFLGGNNLARPGGCQVALEVGREGKAGTEGLVGR